MAYDEALAERVRGVLAGHEEVTERAMFGGIAWMLRGNMAVGIVRDDLMVRVGPDAHDAALREPHVRPMDFTGRPMKGYVYVSGEGVTEPENLRDWVRDGLTFAATLPPKPSHTPSAEAKPAKE